MKSTVGIIVAAISMAIAATSSAAGPSVAKVRIANYPIGIAVEATSAWVSTHRDSILYRVDTRTNRIVDRIDIGQNSCGQVGLAFGRVWVPHCDTATSVVVVDAASKQVVGKVEAWPLEIAFGYGSAWMWSPAGDHSEVLRIDPATLATVAHIPLPSPGSVVRGPGGIWLVSEDGTVSRIDPATNRVATTTRYGPPGGAAGVFAGGFLYILNLDAARMYRFDPATGRSKTLAVSGILNRDDPDLEVGLGLVWARVSNRKVVGINPRTGLVVRRLTVDAPGGGYLAVDRRSVWQPSALHDIVYRHVLR